MAASHPDTWTTPKWHPDFGNAEEETECLRRFAKALLAACPQTQLRLEKPEAGYTYVTVMLYDTTIAEVYCVKDAVPSRSLRYGVFRFKDDQEYEDYCTTEAEAAALIEALVSSPVT